MNTHHIAHNGILLPAPEERKQIFHYLKRISSYTAWHRISTYYRDWVEAMGQCVVVASERGIEGSSGIKESHYVEAIQGLAHFEEGLQRLLGGDKRIFKFDANGEFAMANRPLEHWSTYLIRMFEWHEHPSLNDDNTPGWSHYHNSFEALASAWGECAIILEARRLDAPAPLVYNHWLKDYLSSFQLPHDFPDVPEPEQSVLIPTGKSIPCSGIWEPVDVPKAPVFSLFRQQDPPKGPFPPIGCMNYLHGGSPAPQAKQKFGNDRIDVDVTWRLLWWDDRYRDGTIPREEQEYAFLRPSVTPQSVANDTSAS